MRASQELEDEVIEFLAEPGHLDEQHDYALDLKKSSKRGTLIGSIIALPFGIIVGIVLILFAMSMPREAPSFIPFTAGLGAIVGPLFMIVRALGQSTKTSIHMKRPLSAMCREFYQRAFADKAHEADRGINLIEICEIFPIPVLEEHESEWSSVGRKWESLRKPYAEDDESFRIRGVEVDDRERDDSEFVDLTITVYGDRFDEMVFYNQAIKDKDHWFLIHPEPLTQQAAHNN